jgi:DNA-binding transcriptional MocR family regulator
MDALRGPNLTDDEVKELRALNSGTRVTNEFLVRLAEHYLRAEADGVLNPARHFAEHLYVERQTVLTYMRMARNRGLIVKNNR